MYETLLMRYRQAAREGAELAARLEQGQADCALAKRGFFDRLREGRQGAMSFMMMIGTGGMAFGSTALRQQVRDRLQLLEQKKRELFAAQAAIHQLRQQAAQLLQDCLRALKPA